LSDSQESPRYYVNIKIPQELIEEIEKVIKRKKLGYRSRAEFVIEACRDRLLRLRELS
jgi:metal-responsive CopG/Arc/MetJ family transcriptional regulator